MNWNEWEEKLNIMRIPLSEECRKTISILNQLQDLAKAEESGEISPETAKKCAWAIYESVPTIKNPESENSTNTHDYWPQEIKEEYQEWVYKNFCPKVIEIDEKRTHYHFKRRKDLKMAMYYNANPWDTFSYGEKCPTKQQLIEG